MNFEKNMEMQNCHIRKQELIDFIRSNWQIMSDEEIATRWSYTTNTIRTYRRRLGLKHKAERKLSVADAFIESNWNIMSDEEMAIKFSCSPSTVACRRLNLGLARKRGSGYHKKKVDIADLGTETEVWEALVNGGKTIAGIVREKGLPISRERARQLIGQYSLTGKAKQRTALWYANKVGRPELADKEVFEKLFKDTRSISHLADNLQVRPEILRLIADKLGVVKRKMFNIELKCGYPRCNRTFKRLKCVIDKEKKRNPEIKFCCSREHYFKLCWLRKKQKESQAAAH